MIYTRVVAIALALSSAEALLQPACCSSRLALSRVTVQRAALCMCEAEEPAAVVAEVPEVPEVPVVAEVAEVAAVAEVAVAEEPAIEAPKRERKAGGKTALSELTVGGEVEGKIRSVMAYGAFVDIGAATDGLLHVSEICNEYVKDANEKLTAGDKVTCKIKSINMEKNQLALTCKDGSEPSRGGGGGRKRADLSEYEGADSKVFITGKVNSITEYGAFVSLKEGVDGLVHISAIQEGGVGKVGDVLTAGQEVQVRIVQFDKAKRRIGLSMLPWVEGEEKKGGRGGRGGGGGRDFGFDDSALKLNPEELEALTVEDEEFTSSFEAAFTRAQFVADEKAAGKNYARLRL